ncbi:purine and uridine phosphorylase [Camillea tinctor]|nr:purine and uridine phosphorylase [Camillea tinctor]
MSKRELDTKVDGVKSEPEVHIAKKRKKDKDREEQSSVIISRPSLTNEDYTIGWICTTNTELIAARAFLDEEHKGPGHQPPNNTSEYVLGTMGGHNVVIPILPHGDNGKDSTTTAVAKMLHNFSNVRIGLMVGIGGGAPSEKHDIRLGDIVVSSPANGKGGVLQYDFGKTIQDERFHRTGFLNQPPTVLRAAITGLETDYELYGYDLEANIQAVFEKFPRLRRNYSRPNADTDRLYPSNSIHKDGVCCNDSTVGNQQIPIQRVERSEHEDNTAIHYGLIASTNQLMNDACLRDKLAAEDNVLCFEMEAAGLMNNFPCLVIRGICDYSDTHKNKAWQGFAAMSAAAYAKDLLRQIPPRRIENAKKNQGNDKN